jgi:hypothetical protein
LEDRRQRPTGIEQGQRHLSLRRWLTLRALPAVMTGRLIGIAVHVQLTLMVMPVPKWQAKVKRTDPKAERIGWRRSEENER